MTGNRRKGNETVIQYEGKGNREEQKERKGKGNEGNRGTRQDEKRRG